MKTLISIIAEKKRPLATGEFPLAIRLHKDNKRKYIRLGISVNPKYWDDKKGKIKSNCPNFEYMDNLIFEKISLYQRQVLEFKQQEDLTDQNSLLMQQRSLLVK